MSNNNQFFNSKKFVLVKVQFNNVDGNRYTYAAAKILGLVKGDLVVVPTGNSKDLNLVSGFSVAQVTSITENMSLIPNDFEIKSVVQKIDMKIHRAILRSYRKYSTK